MSKRPGLLAPFIFIIVALAAAPALATSEVCFYRTSGELSAEAVDDASLSGSSTSGQLQLPHEDSGASCLTADLGGGCGSTALTLFNDCAVAATWTCDGEPEMTVEPGERGTYDDGPEGGPEERIGQYQYDCVVTIDDRDILLDASFDVTEVPRGEPVEETSDEGCSTGGGDGASPVLVGAFFLGLIVLRRRRA